MVEMGAVQRTPDRRAPWPYRPRADVAAQLRDGLVELRSAVLDIDPGRLAPAIARTERMLTWAIADLVCLDATTWEGLVAQLEEAGRRPEPTVAQPPLPITRPVHVQPEVAGVTSCGGGGRSA